MNNNRMIRNNVKANARHYALYAFALTFSAALYFAFVTLQFDPSMDEIEGSVKGAASIGAASVLLIVIVAVFNLYANKILMRRRGKEIGLLQLVGMSKGSIFRLITAEHLIVYFSSMAAGILLGFASSRLLLMILLRITGIHAIAGLRFSIQALMQTLIVFAAIFALLASVNFVFIRRQSILSLFRYASSTEAAGKRLSWGEAVTGLLGLLLVGAGYWLSSELFGGAFTTVPALFGAMVAILGSVIIGTYLFYKGSVRLVFDRIRRRRGGYLSVRAVLSLSSMLFRMKSNALLLTVVTTVSALAIGLLSLSYISYYSAEKSAEQNVPAHFTFAGTAGADAFLAALKDNGIEVRETRIEVLSARVDLSAVIGVSPDFLQLDPASIPLPVVSDASVPWIEVDPGQTLFAGYNDLTQKFMALKPSGAVSVRTASGEPVHLDYLGLDRKFPVSWYFTSGGMPTAVIDDSLFDQLAKEAKAAETAAADPAARSPLSMYIGIDIVDEGRLAEANLLFRDLGLGEEHSSDSRLDMSTNQKMTIGLMLFIVGFLGLAFLVTSGCILYFKQMDESEDERPAYTILRKLGFTRGDLLRGVRLRQLFNFGIPLSVGLLHGFFAVQSGWFLFGTELWTPMLIVMGLYAALYSIFGFLSVLHYKRVIREAL